MQIKMNKFGKNLITRVSGVKVHDEILSATNNLNTFVVFDFAGVDTITNSFADQVFGVLALEFGMDTLKRMSHFINVEPFQAAVIRNAIDNRLELEKVCM